MPPRYLLDTNILIAYCRAGDLGNYIETTYTLRAASQVPFISIVTEGELLSIAKKNNWGSNKIQTMITLFQSFIRINLDLQGILQAYAEIDHASQYPPSGSSQKMGKNDLWIAATAKVTGAHLLTTDRDFDHLDGTHITRYWIDPTSKI
jgi:tRNA(fMet)-specific endonuclease VapC